MQPEQKDDAGAPHGDVQEQKNDKVKGFMSVAKKSAEEFLPKGTKPLYKWIRDEWSGIKVGRSLFIILALVIIVVSALLMHTCDSTKLEFLNSHHAISNSFLLGMITQNEKDKRTSETTIQDLKSDINRLTTEKTSAENRAALFETIPLQVPSIITNLSHLIATQPTNQQQLLLLSKWHRTHSEP